jgi:hypothetical protein
MGWFLFLFFAVPFALMNDTAFRKEPRQADAELQVFLKEKTLS